MIHLSKAAIAPCPGYGVSMRFPDVDADVLAREAATEQDRAAARTGSDWSRYLQRVLPALERDLPAELAQALVQDGHGAVGARRHAVAMRRRSIAAGDVRRMRFWGDVLEAIERGVR